MNRTVQSSLAFDVREIESELTRIWCDVLGLPVERIGLDDNFFSLGGDSLLIARVMDRVNSRYFTERPEDVLPITLFFSLGTIRGLVAHLHAGLSGGSQPQFHPATAEVDAIAVIGMSGRFPGAPDLVTFWRNLRDGVESIRSFPEAELLEAGIGAGELRAPSYVRSGAVLDNVRDFDAAYFGLTPREAALTSPEQRLLLECAEEAFQEAGYGGPARDSNVGVFVGSGLSSYLLENLAARAGRFESTEAMAMLASNTGAATRISYLLNLTGPSITLDTACSSSLVAIHQACQALLRDDCGMALAGGATVRLFAPRGYHAEEGSIFSPDGHCRPFDRDARGTVSSSGAGIVLLKRRSQAVADGDTIHAVIRGTAINNDGGGKVGYTAPSPAGQAAVIRRALAAARVDAHDIQFLETHGTATALGDRIEIAALNEVFPVRRAGEERCMLGAIKANIGHVEAAAGVAGLIKVVLALKHGQIPPAIHFREPGDAPGLARSAFSINPQLTSWPASSGPRRAGVSSFGIGGTNAHAVLEEELPAPGSLGPRPSQLVIVSARSDSALRNLRRSLGEQLLDAPRESLADVAYTLQVGRKEFSHRHFVVASACPEAGRMLLDGLDTVPPTQNVGAERAQAVFMFPGQGSQQPRMTQEIYATEPEFREQMDRCAQILKPHWEGRDLRDILYGATPDSLSDTELCQPALFAVEYSLARLWMSWGVKPLQMIGHSLGEYVAACLSGVFTLEDALMVVAARGRLMQATPPGKMLAIRTDRAATERLLPASCSLAAVNGPRSCVVSGPPAVIDQLREVLSASNVSCAEVGTTRAFHSALMDGVLQDFADVLRKVRWGEVRIPFISNLTGTLVGPEHAVTSAEYWVAHLRRTVDFAAGANALLQGVRKIFIEVGPGTVLASFVRSMPGAHSHAAVSSGRRADDSAGDEHALLSALGRAWQNGAGVDWQGFNAHSRLRRVPLPTYPFERRRHWIERAGSERAIPQRAIGECSIPKRAALADWFHVPVWRQQRRLPTGVATSRDGKGEADCLLLIGGWEELESALSQRLSERGTPIVRVDIGGRYAREGQHYEVDPLDGSGYAQLFADLKARGLSVGRIVHAAEAHGADPSSELPDERRLGRGVLNVLDLCRALMGQRHHRVELTLITRSAHVVTGDESISPAGAMLAAAGRVVGREFQNILCRSIDFTPPSAPGERWRAMNDALAEEIVTLADDELVVLRGTTRWVRAYEHLRPDVERTGQGLLREGGTYLVTGGLGGMGWTLAVFLARELKAKLILVGRSPFPERAEWSALLESVTGPETLRTRIREIRALEALGAEIVVVPASVASQADMERVANIARTRFGGLNGVIHTAGVAGGGAIFLKTREMAMRVLAPKVAGTWILHEAFKRFDLDFFVCCSSLASVLTPAGQFDYSAANAYQDAFCQAQDGLSRTRYISIDWDAWKDVGMAATTAVPAHLREQRARELASGITCTEGAEVLSLVLNNPLPQWVICTHELDPSAKERRALRNEAAPGTSPIQRQNTAQAPATESAPHAQNGHGTTGEIRSALALIWQDLLGVEANTPDADFFELGGDSLLAVQLRTRLESHFARPVPLKALLSRSTLAGMTQLLQEAG